MVCFRDQKYLCLLRPYLIRIHGLLHLQQGRRSALRGPARWVSDLHHVDGMVCTGSHVTSRHFPPLQEPPAPVSPVGGGTPQDTFRHWLRFVQICKWKRLTRCNPMKTAFYPQCFRWEVLSTEFLTQVESARGWSDVRPFAVLLKCTFTPWPELQRKLSYVWVSFKLTSVSMNSRLMTLAWGLGRLQMAASQNVQITLLWAPWCQNYAATRMRASYCKAGSGIPLLNGCHCRVARPQEKTTVEMDLFWVEIIPSSTQSTSIAILSKRALLDISTVLISAFSPTALELPPLFLVRKIKPVLES